MRVMQCECGHMLRGETDDELMEQGRRHVAEMHPELGMSDEQLRELVTANARDE